MNFSNLNPRNWFRREEPKAPPIPHADGQPKYKVGQHCLVIKFPGRESLIGSEVILIRAWPRFCMAGQGDTVGGWAWRTDLSEPYTRLDGTKSRLVFPEECLIPIDDEMINEELRQEVIDDFGTKKVQFNDLLKRLDKEIDELQEQVKRKQAI